MKVIECKQVDQWDGGDRHNFGFYVDASVSDEAIKIVHPYCYVSKRTLVIFDSLEEEKNNQSHVLRKKAWDKLSPMERKAIGMSDPN